MIQNRVFINVYDAVCSAADSPEGIFNAICEHRTGIELYNSSREEKIIALGKIKKEFSIEEILLSFTTPKAIYKDLNIEDQETQ